VLYRMVSFSMTLTPNPVFKVTALLKFYISKYKEKVTIER